MDIKPTPAALHRIEVLPVERYARTYKLHVVLTLTRQPLAGTIRVALLFFQQDFLLQQEIHEFRVRTELISKGIDDPLEHCPELLHAFLSIHGHSPLREVQQAGVLLGIVAHYHVLPYLHKGKGHLLPMGQAVLADRPACPFVSLIIIDVLKGNILFPEELLGPHAPGTGAESVHYHFLH
ncbi:MAG: hypothetical protein PWP63_2149 [Methanolobus sp.]|nr:hypothetical protein [Methanolobus sp.]